MQYLLFDEVGENIYIQEFETKAAAIDAGEKLWHTFLKEEQEKRKRFYVLKSADPDEEAEKHFDGDFCKIWK